MLRGDPSDGLPGLKGVGAVAAASMIRQYGGVPAILEARRLSEHDQDYLTRALRVVPPVPDLSIDLPPGRRDRYPDDPAALNTLMADHRLQAASSRLVEALNEELRGS
jgi:5'-3' exonuclease